AAKGLGAKEWNNSLKTKLSLLPKKLFRIRMSRNFGMKMLTMTNLSTECLIQLTKLGYDATPLDLAAKGLGAKEWNNSLKTKLSLLPKKLFRIRMSRNFGMKMLTMTNLSTECLIQLTKLGYD